MDIFKVVISKQAKKDLEKIPKNLFQKLISWVDMNTNQKLIKDLEKMSGQKFTLANLLASLRENDEKTQGEFAETLGVSKQFVSDLENNRRSISPKMAENFAKKLGYSPKQFVRLCLQDMIKKQGLHYEVDLKVA